MSPVDWGCPIPFRGSAINGSHEQEGFHMNALFGKVQAPYYRNNNNTQFINKFASKEEETQTRIFDARNFIDFWHLSKLLVAVECCGRLRITLFSMHVGNLAIY